MALQIINVIVILTEYYDTAILIASIIQYGAITKILYDIITFLYGKYHQKDITIDLSQLLEKDDNTTIDLSELNKPNLIEQNAIQSNEIESNEIELNEIEQNEIELNEIEQSNVAIQFDRRILDEFLNDNQILNYRSAEEKENANNPLHKLN